MMLGRITFSKAMPLDRGQRVFLTLDARSPDNGPSDVFADGDVCVVLGLKAAYRRKSDAWTVEAHVQVNDDFRLPREVQGQIQSGKGWMPA